MNMDVISLSKANKTLNKIKQLDESVVAPLAEDRFTTVDARLDWLEGQASKIKVENSKQLDLSQGVFNNTELINEKVQLKCLGEAYLGYTENLIDGSGIASASSTGNGNYPPSKAFDGINNNYYNYWHSSGNGNEWLMYDFGAGNEKAVSKYRYAPRNESGAPKNWTFEGSNDATNWTILDTQTDQTNWTAFAFNEYTFENTTPYRYYRFNFTANNGAATYNAAEIEMFEKILVPIYSASGTWESPIIDLGEGWKETKLVDIVKQFQLGEDLTPPMTSNTSPSPYIVTASSRVSGFDEWKAFDHNYIDSSQWIALGYSGWIQFDFGSPVTIVKYAIRARNSSNAKYSTPRDWTLKGSNDGTNFTIIDSHVLANTPEWSPNERREFVLSAPVTYRYFRIDGFVDPKWGAYMGIGEIEYIGPDKSNLILEISTSTDGVSFTPYATLDPNNPPQGRYIKLRATLSAQAQPGQTKTLDFNQSSPENMMTLNEYTEANGELQLKNTYTYNMTDDGVLGAGKQFSFTINKANFKSIESIGVN
jgi:hypothetical protein